MQGNGQAWKNGGGGTRVVPRFMLYSQAPDGEMLPVQICFIAASVRVSAFVFFRSAIGLVFKRAVEFHVRHQETMSAIFLRNTYLFCNHCINYLMNHVTRRGDGVPRLARLRDHCDPTLHSYALSCFCFWHKKYMLYTHFYVSKIRR